MDENLSSEKIRSDQIEHVLNKIYSIKAHWENFSEIRRDCFFITHSCFFEKCMSDLKNNYNNELNTLRIELCKLRGE